MFFSSLSELNQLTSLKLSTLTFKIVEKAFCLEKKSFLSQFRTFLNTKPLRSEIDEVKIEFKLLSLKKVEKSEKKSEIRYKIQGKVNGKLGRVTFNLLPAFLFPKSSHQETENFQRWIAQVSMRKNLPRAFILAVEHFLVTYRDLS